MKTCMSGVMLAMLAGMAAAQPVQWRVEDGGNGHWYEARVWQQPLSWTASQALAASSGGYLATVTFLAENNFIFQRLRSQAACVDSVRRPGWYLGGRQDRLAPDYGEPAGGWRWVTGEPWVFSNWYPGRPDDFGAGGQDDLYMADAGYAPFWDDSGVGGDSNTMCGAIIEWSADCNNDGIVDKGQILSGELVDTNNNGIPDAPGIAVQPTDQSVGVDSPVTFIVEVAASTCATPVTYQWQRRNPAVADPAAANAWVDVADGGGFFGTRAPNLSISRPIPALATGYRCKIGGGCGCEPNPGGFVYTNTVNFSVACPADFNADGGIDFGDVEAFFERWENGC